MLCHCFSLCCQPSMFSRIGDQLVAISDPDPFQSRSLSIPHSQRMPQKLQVQISMVQCRSQATCQEKISTKRFTWDTCPCTVIHNVPVVQKGGWSCHQSCSCVHQTLLPAVMRWNRQTSEQCVHYFLLFLFPRHLVPRSWLHMWTASYLQFLPSWDISRFSQVISGQIQAKRKQI